MGMEIPVISTRITGIPELVDSGANGFLIPPGDFEALFEKIKLLLQQPDLCKRLGKLARKTVTADYNLEDNCRRLAEIFNSELGKK
jgi:glycosyltransferase involved in cell wall biosynthesis